MAVALKASIRVQEPPTPLKVTVFRNCLPAMVIVFPAAVASKLTEPVKLRFMAGIKLSEPYIFNRVEPAPASTGLLAVPVQSMFCARHADALRVTVCPAAVNELASKNTSSSAVGICV